MALALPDDVQWYIWNIYKKAHVLPELLGNKSFLWSDPSERLVSLVSCDVGAIEHGHHELHDMIEDHNMWAYHECVSGRCANCEVNGFPCRNLACYGFENMNMEGLFQSNF